VEDERALLTATSMVQQAEHAHRAVAVGEPPLRLSRGIEHEPADAEHPPDVDDRFWICQREFEEIRVAGEGLHRQLAVERRGAERLLDGLALRLRHLTQRQRLNCLPASLAA
jgi:hypothetical protein